MDLSDLEITPLGAGCEVGRSCIHMTYRGQSILFDCGIHPAFSGVGALPIFDKSRLDEVDVCLVTHFHLDHCGGVPYLLNHTSFAGAVLMTPATKAVCNLLWRDYTRVYTGGPTVNNRPLFSVEDVVRTMKVVQTIDFHEVVEVHGIKITCFGAGHVIGACQFLVEIGGVRVLYTGDFSREDDRHVPKAEIPDVDVHVLICESTFGIRVTLPRKKREEAFLRSVQQVVSKGGKCLLPVFALGRAQEILLMLEEFWSKHERRLGNIPIYFVSPLSIKCMPILSGFISSAGDGVKNRAMLTGTDPFTFRFIQTVGKVSSIKGVITSPNKPAVVMAAPGMLQTGPSRELFELLAGDPMNKIILTGYAVKGTVADALRRNPQSVQISDGAAKVKASFEEISFSAHSDFDQTWGFVEALRIPNIVLVHGEKNECQRLQAKMISKNPKLSVFAPEVLQTVRLQFPPHVACLAMGSLARRIKLYCRVESEKAKGKDESKETPTPLPDTCEAVAISSTSHPAMLVQLEDLEATTGLRPMTLTHQVKYPYPFRLDLWPAFGELCRETLKVAVVQTGLSMVVAASVQVALSEVEAPANSLPVGIMEASWKQDPRSDLYADAIFFLAAKIHV
ncbi:MAG: uncharacterized protein KVP18_001281 [Porospora cf. gigantea A]|uniref:uncharacterized protein n=1 Tax=Porospora cf. gigantea A TaxID=2853593 RepID=UPI0035594AFE|nr:MAG: hypothetical protein KVP18_001281 [Porospora cf. gigantea A]